MNRNHELQTLDRKVNEYLLTASGHLKDTSASIDLQRLGALGAAAGSAMVMMTQAEAAVVHPSVTTVSVNGDPSNGTTWTTFAPINIVGTGADDFALFAARSDSDHSYSSFGLNGTRGGGNNAVLGGTLGNNVWKLASGAAIGPSASPWDYATARHADIFYVYDTGGFLPASNWDPMSESSPTQSGYAGVRFQRSGQTHYGWIKLEISFVGGEPGVWRLSATDWAYEACPDQPIEAGATTGGPAVCGGQAPTAIPVAGPIAYGLATLALGALGMGNLRRRRERMKTEDKAPTQAG